MEEHSKNDTFLVNGSVLSLRVKIGIKVRKMIMSLEIYHYTHVDLSKLDSYQTNAQVEPIKPFLLFTFFNGFSFFLLQDHLNTAYIKFFHCVTLLAPTSIHFTRILSDRFYVEENHKVEGKGKMASNTFCQQKCEKEGIHLAELLIEAPLTPVTVSLLFWIRLCHLSVIFHIYKLKFLFIVLCKSAQAHPDRMENVSEDQF